MVQGSVATAGEPGRVGASPPATPGFRLGLTPCAASTGRLGVR